MLAGLEKFAESSKNMTKEELANAVKKIQISEETAQALREIINKRFGA